MPSLDLKTATADELWDYCLKEYDSRSRVIQFLIDRFFAAIGNLLDEIPEEARILEVGCGAGESSRRIMKMLNGQHFEASEFDPRYVSKLVDGNLDCPVRQESVYKMDRPDNSFDCAILLEVLEHLDDPKQALQELFRVSNRHVIISVPNEPLWRVLNFCRGAYLGDFGNTPGHMNHWSKRSLSRLVSGYGRVIRVSRPTPWLLMLAEVDRPNA